MLDKYLETLTKEASTKGKKQEAFGAASVDELSKLAGIKLAEDICTNCAAKMTKLGSIYQCACGMMKKAMSKCSKCGSAMEKTSAGEKCSSCGVKHAAAPRGQMRGAGKGVGMPGGLRRNIQKGPCPEGGPGEGKGGGRGKGLPRALAANVSKVKAVQDSKKPGAEVPGGLKKSAGDMPPFLSQDRPKKVKEIYSALKRDNPDMPAEKKARIAARQGKKGKQEQGPPYKGPLTKGASALEEAGLNKIAATQISLLAAQEDYDLEKIAARLENMGMDKEAIGGLLKAIGTAGKGLFQAAKGVGKAGPRIGMGQAARTGAQGIGQAARGYGGQVAQTFRGARGMGARGMGPQAPGGMGVGRSLLETAKAHPELAVAAGAVPAFAAGRMTKSSSVLTTPEIIEAGEAAGRMLAKVAQGVPMEELQESMEEAKTREDIPGRARRWQRAGGAGGILGGGLLGGGIGAGASKLLGGKGRVLLPAATSLAGMTGGGMLGQRLGKAHGAEEATADRAISLLRAMRAHRIGAQSGYGTGLRRGYMARRGTGE